MVTGDDNGIQDMHYTTNYEELVCENFVVEGDNVVAWYMGADGSASFTLREQQIIASIAEDGRGTFNFASMPQGGKAWIVSTGQRDNITNAMHYLGIEGMVDGVLSSDDVVKSKPAPDCFLKAMDIAGVTPSETIIFEDSEIGLAAAEASGAAHFKVELDF